jgi:hypothetical protein
VNQLTKKYVRYLAQLRERVGTLERSNQTGYGSIEGGRSIEVRDVSGELIGTVGSLPDGTVGTVDLVPTPPPTPDTVDVTPGVETVVVRWGGRYVVPADPSVTVAYVGVHVTQTPDDLSWTPSVESELTQITPGGGTVILPGDSGVETGVVLVTVSASGVWSAPTNMFRVVPQYAADPAVVDELVADVDIVRTDGVPPTAPPGVEVFSEMGVISVKLTPPPDNPDPITEFSVYVNGVSTVTSPSTWVTVRTDINGVRLPYNTDTSIQATAWDGDGEGPLSAVMLGRLVQIETVDVADYAVTIKQQRSSKHQIY